MLFPWPGIDPLQIYNTLLYLIPGVIAVLFLSSAFNAIWDLFLEQGEVGAQFTLFLL